MIDLISLIFSFLAVIISAYAVLYTQLFNKLNVIVSNGYCEPHYNGKSISYYEIWFSIKNFSNLPISISNITLYDSNNVPIKVIEDLNSDSANIFPQSDSIFSYKVESKLEKISMIYTVKVDNKLIGNKTIQSSVSLDYCK